METDLPQNRFQAGADRYASYLATPEGRLRLDLAFENLKEFLPQGPGPLRALDLGCGPGAIALRLAQLGMTVTLLDSSQAMLDLAKSAAQDAGIVDKISLLSGDAAEAATLLRGQKFDVILCHNILEFLDEPIVVLRDAARMLRSASAILSVVVRNRVGEVLKAAICAGDLQAAEHMLNAESAQEALLGGAVKLFTARETQAMLREAQLTVIAERGIRVVSDYLPAEISRDTEYEPILRLERRLAKEPEFMAIARYQHYLAQRRDNQLGSGK